ncbi:hypothetical protein SAMN04488065_1827 [Haloplanus vescus]|mgnify:CR=1 FL=1|uniref:Uncharacterized protein n=1 Tax=Haloplanus vescus TaxID=555874 RepID=A0A1H3YE92_9EURY|nr:hypothetical protein [Haloplanus vescus]SEA09876.1 hypothetical protein SAMN04488065_1827 [Haloplanus vescus]
MTVWTPSLRVGGGMTVLGGLFVALVGVPSRWFGPQPTDSYVFDPPLFSSLWVERTVIPVVAVAATLLLLVGLLSLLWRDRESLARWQRWFAAIGVVGAAIVALGTMLVMSTQGVATDDITSAMNVLIGVALGLLGVVLLFPSLMAWGVGYLRDDHRRLGAALVGGPLVSGVFVAVDMAAGVSFEPLGGLVVLLPLSVAALVVGVDLWERPSRG